MYSDALVTQWSRWMQKAIILDKFWTRQSPFSPSSSSGSSPSKNTRTSTLYTTGIRITELRDFPFSLRVHTLPATRYQVLRFQFFGSAVCGSIFFFASPKRKQNIFSFFFIFNALISSFIVSITTQYRLHQKCRG